MAALAGSSCLLEPLGGGNARLLEVRLDVAQPVGDACNIVESRPGFCLTSRVGWRCLLASAGQLATAFTQATRPPLQVLEPYQLPPEARQEAEGTTSLERAARQVARERAALSALPEAAQGHALQVRAAQAAATRWLAWQCGRRQQVGTRLTGSAE